MPIAKIHILEGRYDKDRLDNVSRAVQDALINTLGIPPEDFYQLILRIPARSLQAHTLVRRNELYRRSHSSRRDLHRGAIQGEAIEPAGGPEPAGIGSGRAFTR